MIFMRDYFHKKTQDYIIRGYLCLSLVKMTLLPSDFLQTVFPITCQDLGLYLQLCIICQLVWINKVASARSVHKTSLSTQTDRKPTNPEK